jgi:hypothetical protein
MNTLPITSLASLKRAVAIPNVVIRVLDHWQDNLKKTTRTPTKVQTNGYFYDGPDRTGKVVRMWAPIPKASELRFNPDGSVTFHPATERSWTLSFEVHNG